MHGRKIACGLVLAAGVLAACGQAVPGTALPVADIAPAQAPTTTTNPLESPPVSGTPKAEQRLCGLLRMADLPFAAPGVEAAEPKAESNIDSNFDQSCRWTVLVGASRVKVGAQLYFRAERDLTIKDPAGTFTVGGRALSYAKTGADSCVLAMRYADGNVGIGVIDSTGQFGPQCDVGKKIAETLLTREPDSL